MRCDPGVDSTPLLMADSVKPTHYGPAKPGRLEFHGIVFYIAVYGLIFKRTSGRDGSGGAHSLADTLMVLLQANQPPSSWPGKRTSGEGSGSPREPYADRLFGPVTFNRVPSPLLGNGGSLQRR
jgi:hypothetical protein